MIKIGDKKYLEIKEFAKNKGVTVQTVYNWIKDNRVESKKMMGKIIVRL